MASGQLLAYANLSKRFLELQHRLELQNLVNLIDSVQRGAVHLIDNTHRRNVGMLSRFYRYFNGVCSKKLTAFKPVHRCMFAKLDGHERNTCSQLMSSLRERVVCTNVKRATGICCFIVNIAANYNSIKNCINVITYLIFKSCIHNYKLEIYSQTPSCSNHIWCKVHLNDLIIKKF